MNKHDFSGSGCAPKHQTRVDTLNFVRQKGFRLWSRQHKALGRDWVELTATNDPSLRLLLEQDALKAGMGRYIGINGPNPYDASIDQDEANRASLRVLDANKTIFKSPTDQGLVEWRFGLLEDILDARQGLDNVGVLVADGQYSISHHQIALTQAPFFKFALTQKRNLGQFLLVINLVFRGTAQRNARDALSVWSHTASRALGLPQPIPSDKFHIYRNAGGRWPMCLCRILL